jgi:uncharacterized protein (TIGR02246 family)
MSVDYQNRQVPDSIAADTPAPTATTVPADETAIRELFQHLLDAWGNGDATAYAAQFTEGAEYVTFDGSHVKGRAAITTSHQPLFARWLKGTRLVGKIISLRFVNADVALVHATGSTVFPGEAKSRPSRDSIQTLVATKHDGTWRFAAFHNTRIQRRSPLQWFLFGIATRVFRR